jgi:hypothetical protein
VEGPTVKWYEWFIYDLLLVMVAGVLFVWAVRS